MASHARWLIACSLWYNGTHGLFLLPFSRNFLFRCSALLSSVLLYVELMFGLLHAFNHDISNSIIQSFAFISLDLTVAYSMRESESITVCMCTVCSVHLFFVCQTIWLVNAHATRACTHNISFFSSFSSFLIRFSSFLFGHANGTDWNVKWLKSIERVCAFFTVNWITAANGREWLVIERKLNQWIECAVSLCLGECCALCRGTKTVSNER